MKENHELLEGVQALGIPLPEEGIDRFERYLDLLEKWNAVINLTAVRDRARMVTLHLLDSLTVVSRLSGKSRLLDVGSGGGMPGIPLAIALPQLQVTLLEPNQKKAAFLRQAKLELGLENVRVVAERVECWQTDDRFDAIVSRAFSDLPDFVAGARRLLSPEGSIIAMKGVVPFEEISRLTPDLTPEVIPVVVPHLAAERHLIVIGATRT
ncbi:MAG: 16S rRNA (guanine(527)-N(7))-methyltransferase RsmG [Betaproteobacteria bacterium]|nr:16S rRNA (guanine(527)-N(7))-methyltransferase RsmG [Betaproteobacteria bacterium]